MRQESASSMDFLAFFEVAWMFACRKRPPSINAAASSGDRSRVISAIPRAVPTFRKQVSFRKRLRMRRGAVASDQSFIAEGPGRNWGHGSLATI